MHSLLLVVLLAQPSQPPAPRPTNTSQEQKQQGAAEKESAGASSEQVQPSPTATPQQAVSDKAGSTVVGDSNGQEQQSTPGWITWASGLSNIAIAIFTAILTGVTIWQGMHLRRTFVAAHPPQVDVREADAKGFQGLKWVNNTGSVTGFEGGPSVEITGSISIGNTGGTKANTTRIQARFLITERLPAIPPFDGVAPIPNRMLKPGAWNRIDVTPCDLTQRDFASWVYGGVDIYLIGQVAYKDELGDPSQMAFCLIYDRKIGRFQRAQDEADYDYPG